MGADTVNDDKDETIVSMSKNYSEGETAHTTPTSQESDNEAKPVDHKVVKEGWVQKENHNILHGLSQRYCKLIDGSLELYLKEEDDEPLVSMVLEGASVEVPLFKRRGHALRLNLTSEAGRRNKYHHFVLKFQDGKDFQEWNDAIL